MITLQQIRFSTVIAKINQAMIECVEGYVVYKHWPWMSKAVIVKNAKGKNFIIVSYSREEGFRFFDATENPDDPETIFEITNVVKQALRLYEGEVQTKRRSVHNEPTCLSV